MTEATFPPNEGHTSICRASFSIVTGVVMPRGSIPVGTGERQARSPGGVNGGKPMWRATHGRCREPLMRIPVEWRAGTASKLAGYTRKNGREDQVESGSAL